MVADTGEGYLFTLSHQAETGHEDLVRFKDAGARVAVEYEGEPNLASGVAHEVEPLIA